MLLTVCSCHVTYAFQNESTLYICLNVKELLTRKCRNIWSLSDCNGIRTNNHLVCKPTLNHLVKLTKSLNWIVVTYFKLDLTVCFCHVTYTFQSELTLYIFLNFKKFLTWNRLNIWSLKNCNGSRNHNHLGRKRKLKHLANLTKWVRWIVSTYLYSAFDCMFLSCHIRVPKWIQTLFLPECQGIPYSKPLRYLEFNWMQWNPNLLALSS